MDPEIDHGHDTWTVSQLNREARLIIEGGFRSLWIEGEVSNLAMPASGHMYFSLKDAHAQVRCAFFRQHQRGLSIHLRDGAQVRCKARPSIYEGRGEFQLIVEHVEDAGEGRLRLELEALKKRLLAEGLFDPVHKKCLPTLPARIGVLTSPSGAVLHDIVTTLRRRFPAIAVLLYPIPVQGRDAAPEIVSALTRAATRNEVDALILARGGGSLEDLWCFNDEAVVRALFTCPIPIISAIGHETDVTLADLVADVRAPTPTAAAELLSPDGTEWLSRLASFELRIVRLMEARMRETSQRLDGLTARIRHPRDRLQNLGLRIEALESRLEHAIRRHVQIAQGRLAGLARTLDAVSPGHTLNRGYAIVTDAMTGAVLSDASGVAPGFRVRARLARGSLDCVVEAVVPIPDRD